MLAIYRDDLHGRLVVELPGRVFVMGKTPQEIVDRLTSMGATITSVARQSWMRLATDPKVRRNDLGHQVFVDRGAKLTFEREHVSDDAIVEALLEARNRFGSPLALTGDCAVFNRRMARLATELGIEIENPELQDVVVAAARAQRERKVVSIASRCEPRT